MDHYIDIKLRPDPEFPVMMLMGALYGKLHRMLVDLEANNIGVSFPNHKVRPRTLGDKLRLHGSADALARLMEQPWLTGMRDHVSVLETEQVPRDVQYRVVCRRQFKTNAERVRRRWARRHGESLEKAREEIPDNIEAKVELPFAMLRSRSTGQTFSLFIEHGQLQDEPSFGDFNQYGLSSTATVPWF